MRLKVTPEDFIVTEIVDMQVSKVRPASIGPGDPTRQYRIYLLEKVGWNTLDAISSIADASGVDSRLIGYAGLKDRHARTSQHISVSAEYELISRRDDIRLVFLGFSEDFVSTKVLLGNRFRIRVGGLTAEEADSMRLRADAVREFGYPNYLDDQRFGSVTPEGYFVAERIAVGHLKGALKIHLSQIFPTMKKPERDRRARIAGAWGKWDEVLALCESEEERAVVAPLLEGASRKNLLLALNAIPHEAMSRYIAAYQAFIWNEVLRRLIEKVGVPLTEVAGQVGPYCLPADGEALRGTSGLLNVEIPTVAARLSPCSAEVASLIDEVLAERGLTLSDLNIRGLRSRYFKSFGRKAFVIPDGLAVTNPRPDREKPDAREVSVSFTLPAGSYATMLLKVLTTTA